MKPKGGIAVKYVKSILVSLLVLAVVSFAFDPTIYVSAGVGEPDTLDIHQAYDTVSGEIIYNVYESLIAYKGSSLTEFEPRLATQVPSVKNGLYKRWWKDVRVSYKERS